MIAIIDYGVGNLASIQNMCMQLGVEAQVTNDAEQISQASKLILPGVGNFEKGMENLEASHLNTLLEELVTKKQRPILGICLGAQLMTKHSQEGNVNGLGWIDAITVRFDQSKTNGFKVPHMGWSEIQIQKENPLLINLPSEPRFYFVHAYHFLFDNKEQISATSTYNYDFACAFQKGNIFGTQFHPEKSHKFGMKVIENFYNLCN